MVNFQTTTDETTLYDLWHAFYRKRYWIIAFTILFTLLVFGLSKLKTPVYEAQTVFYVPFTPSSPMFTVAGSSKQVDNVPMLYEPEEKAAGVHLGILGGEGVSTEVLKAFPDVTMQDLRHNVDFVMGKYFDMKVVVRDSDPGRAAAIANYYPVAYRQFHKRSLSEQNLTELRIIDGQIEATRELLHENLSRREREKTQSGAGSVAQQRLMQEYLQLMELLDKLNGNRIEAQLEADNPGVEVIVSGTADVPTRPIFPLPAFTLVSAFMFSFSLGLFYVLIQEFRSRFK